MAQAWHYRPTSLVLSEAAGAEVRAHSTANRGPGTGRRLRVPVRRASSEVPPTPFGVLFLRWRADAGPVTIYYLGWNPAAGGTEDEIRRAAVQLVRSAPGAGQ